MINETENHYEKIQTSKKRKKSLRRGFWLYPADDNGNSLMASPRRCQKDYDAMKEGILRNLMDSKKLKEGARRQAAKLDPEIIIPDERLREYVDDIFRKDLRDSAYYTFKRAKNSPRAISAYYNFVNAYNLSQKGEHSYGNICCLSLERAETLLREENRLRKKR
ncbi:MAG: hypothetical protein AAF693_19365 [Bacteroidota bacterium]